MKDHAGAIFLAASLWLFGFDNGPRHHWMPHVGIGVLILVLAAFVQTQPQGAAARARTSAA